MTLTDKFKEQQRQARLRFHDKIRFGGNRIKALDRDGYECVSCSMTNKEHIAKWKRSLTVDHIDGNGRYSDKQNNSLDNLQTLCLSCHGKKDKYRALITQPFYCKHKRRGVGAEHPQCMDCGQFISKRR